MGSRGFSTPMHPQCRPGVYEIFQLFGFPLSSRTVVVQRDQDGLSPYAQARTVVRAVGAVKGQADAVPHLRGALPITNTRGLFPGADERSTTALTYLLFDPDSSLSRRTRGAERYADLYFAPRDHVVGVTGSAPARRQQGVIIRDALPNVEAVTLLAIVLIVGVAFRSVVAPFVTVVTAGVAYVATLRTAGSRHGALRHRQPDSSSPSSSRCCWGWSPTMWCSSAPHCATRWWWASRRAEQCGRAAVRRVTTGLRGTLRPSWPWPGSR